MLALVSTRTAASTLLLSFTNCASGYGTALVELFGAYRRKRTSESTFFSAGGRRSPTRII